MYSLKDPVPPEEKNCYNYCYIEVEVWAVFCVCIYKVEEAF